MKNTKDPINYVYSSEFEDFRPIHLGSYKRDDVELYYILQIYRMDLKYNMVLDTFH